MNSDETFVIEFDGGSRGNPGPAAAGIVVRAADNMPIATIGIFIGRATNNVAEYRGLIGGLAKARELGVEKVIVRGDSELIIKQMRGEYRVKHPDLQLLHREASTLAAEFKSIRYEHNLRHKNELADRLANRAMDRKGNVDDAEVDPISEPAPTAPTAGDKIACGKCGCEIEIVSPSRLRPHQLRSFVCCCGTKME